MLIGWFSTLNFIDSPSLLSAKFGTNLAAFGRGSDLMMISLALGLTVGSIVAFGVVGIACRCNPF